MIDYQKVEVKMMQEVVRFFDENPQFEKDNAILKTHILLPLVKMEQTPILPSLLLSNSLI